MSPDPKAKSGNSFHVIADIEILREIVKPPNSLTSTGNAIFRWSEDYLKIATVDGASVMSVEQKVTPSAFEEFDVDIVGDEFAIGIPCRRLSTLLKSETSEKSVEMEYNPRENKTDIKVGSVDYSLGQADIASIREPPTPGLDHDVKVMTHSGIFDKATNILSMVDRRVTFKIDDSEAKIFASGDVDDGSIGLTVANEDDELDADEIDIRFKSEVDEVVADFSVDRLEYIPDFTPDRFFELRLDSEFPMLINTNRADNRIPTTILLAQRLMPQG